MKWIHMITFTLVIVGAANWGLVGLFNFNLVEVLFGATGLVTIIYVLVGLSAVYIAATHMSECKVCAKK